MEKNHLSIKKVVKKCQINQRLLLQARIPIAVRSFLSADHMYR